MRFTLLLALPFLSAMTAMAANVNVDRLDKKWGANDECVSTMPACLLTYLPTYLRDLSHPISCNNPNI